MLCSNSLSTCAKARACSAAKPAGASDVAAWHAPEWSCRPRSNAGHRYMCIRSMGCSIRRAGCLLLWQVRARLLCSIRRKRAVSRKSALSPGRSSNCLLCSKATPQPKMNSRATAQPPSNKKTAEVASMVKINMVNENGSGGFRTLAYARAGWLRMLNCWSLVSLSLSLSV